MEQGRITHTVFFTLQHEPNTQEAADFLKNSADLLSKIPHVEKFKVLNQISPKNQYNFGFYMEFPNREAYEAYNNHPNHVEYVAAIWKKDVKDFMEIDYTINQEA
jgi:hypothetical protein